MPTPKIDPEIVRLQKEAEELEQLQREAEELEQAEAEPTQKVPVKTLKPTSPSQAELGDDVVESKTYEPVQPSEMDAWLFGANQGLTLNFGDELQGGAAVIGELGRRGLENTGLMSDQETVELPGGETEVVTRRRQNLLDTYRKNRNEAREQFDLASELHPKFYFAGNVMGGALLTPGGGLKEGLKQGLKQAAKQGAVRGAVTGGIAGLGASDADLTDPSLGAVGDTALNTTLGTLFGGATGAAAPAIGVGVRKGAQYLKNAGKKLISKGQDLVGKAREKAEAMATKEELANLAKLRGELGGEVQKGSRMTENIRRIPGDLDVRRTVSREMDNLKKSAEVAADRMEEALAKVKAQGLTPDEIIKVGEFRPKPGSSLAEAQRAIDTYADARAAQEKIVERIRLLQDGIDSGFWNPNTKILPPQLMEGEDVTALRKMMMTSPEFAELEQRVLRSNMDDLAGQNQSIMARREAYEQAANTVDDKISERASELLSGEAAKRRGYDLLLRYGLPIASSGTGAMIGGSEGGVIGAGVGAGLGYLTGKGGEKVVAGLAGAGMRPAFQAMYRTVTQYPAVMQKGGELLSGAGRNMSRPAVEKTLNTVAAAAKKVAPMVPGMVTAAQREALAQALPSTSDKIKAQLQSNPQALGVYGPMLQEKLAKDDGSFLTTHYILATSDPEYQKLLKKLQAE